MADVGETIKVECSCGKRIAVPASWAGKRARCPKCKEPIAIPTVEFEGDEVPLPALADDSLAALAEGESVLRLAPVEPAPKDGGVEGRSTTTIKPTGPQLTCPSCGETAPPGAKICVQCGIDLKTGKAITMSDDSHIDAAYTYAESIIRVISFLFFFGIYPIASEAFGTRKPWAVRGIALLTVCVSVWYMFAYLYNPHRDPELAMLMQWSGEADERNELLKKVLELEKSLRESGDLDDNEELQELVSELQAEPVGEFRWYQPLTCALLHDGPVHLAGNLLFLFVFGTRVNMLIGNTLTLISYLLLAFASGLAHDVSLRGEPLVPSLGASGAVMGLAGMYIVLFPATRVHIAIWIRWGLIALFRLHMKIFAARGFWVVLFYIAFDVFYTTMHIETGVAHWAHLGGFIAGAVLASVLLFARLVNARGGDLFTVALGRHAWGLIGKPNARRLSVW